MTTTLSVGDLDAVAAHMGDAGEAPAGPLTATQFSGGRSNLTYRLDDGHSSWVLRTPPRHGRTPSAHDVAREFTVTSALASTDVPVPHPVVLCQDESVLGGPFVVTRFVPGTCIQSRADLDEVPDPILDAMVSSLITTLAALHAVDHVAVGLGEFGRATGYAGRQIRRWTEQWALVGDPELTPLAQELSQRLHAVDFIQDRAAVVHGDYRIDNTLISQDGARVHAVVDWELSTIGDPVADVAMMCVYRHPALDLVLGTPSAWASPRLPAPDVIAGLYERTRGEPLRQWDAHMALGYLKLAVIAAGIDHRFRSGAASGTGFDTAAHAVSPLLEAGLGCLSG
ncbi:acyl-CoA dehydrogenase [Mycolicibacterium murale]|uniref:Acyl-CoA dehydrogenase n=2 Tax=Mycolicibacterium murale TaxID=182220 RepID=A0A7I9WPJ0_9MYCO|nr:phosphotransferase family protein [Mycolicibacterium murale]GFG59288.1 acyl-CoA dehydrogenase [Mycolicibacterium murale]